jgi:hypothetical protein
MGGSETGRAQARPVVSLGGMSSENGHGTAGGPKGPDPQMDAEERRWRMVSMFVFSAFHRA